MKLPNAELALIDTEKLSGYLLSDTHRRGRHKAAFFKRYGFRVEESHTLAEALLRHARLHEVAGRRDSRFGTRYTVEGELEAPDGRRPVVRSIWVIELGSAVPRLVSAYPLARRAV